MKISKLKSILFSLMAITMVTVFLSSCEEQETLPESITSETVETKGLANFILPWGYDEKMTLEEQAEYLNSIDKETLDKLKQSSLIFNYFVSLNKTDVLADNAVYGDIFDESTMASYLTEKEVENFHSSPIDPRWCQCEDEYKYLDTKCGWFGTRWPGAYVYKKYDRERKECHAWFCADKIREVNKRSCD